MPAKPWRTVMWSRTWMCALLGTVAMAAAAVSARAEITAYSEPAYTKTSTPNSFWWHWQAVTGFGIDGQVSYDWWVGRTTTRNGTTTEPLPNGDPRFPDSPHCLLLRSTAADSAIGGVATAPPSAEDGALYEMDLAGINQHPPRWFWDGRPSGYNSTRIDNNKPAISVTLGGV